MNKQQLRPAARREILVAQAAAQRIMLAKNVESWRAPLALADRGLAILRFLKYHPAWIIGGVSLLAAFRPGHRGQWLRRGWIAWKITQKLTGK